MSVLAPLWLRLCPQCGGEELARGDCSACQGAGVLDQDDAPFVAPAPFDDWTPHALVSLSQASRDRDRDGDTRPTTKEAWRLTRTPTGEAAAVRERPRKLTLSEIVELLLTRTTTEHSTVKLARNAKGDTQIEVAVRTGEAGIDTIEQARMLATAQYDELRRLYPLQPS